MHHFSFYTIVYQSGAEWRAGEGYLFLIFLILSLPGDVIVDRMHNIACVAVQFGLAHGLSVVAVHQYPGICGLLGARTTWPREERAPGGL